jgi:hypothetical protein
MKENEVKEYFLRRKLLLVTKNQIETELKSATKRLKSTNDALSKQDAWVMTK